MRRIGGLLGRIIAIALVLFVGVAGLTGSSFPSPVAAHSATASHPTISGRAKVGMTLTASPGTWTPTPSSFLFRWQADGVLIPGATDSTITLSDAQAKKTIRVLVTGLLPSGQATTRTSEPTRGVGLASRLTSTPRPTIAGAVAAGSTLTAVPGNWGPGLVNFSYQWYVNTVKRAGATGATFIPGTSDLGLSVSVAVTGSEPGFVSVTEMSMGTPRVPPSSQNSAHSTPAAPILDAASPVGLGVEVTWEPNPVGENVLRYELIASPDPSALTVGCPAQTVEVPSSDSSAVVPSLCAGVPYAARVAAINVDGSGPASAPSLPAVPLVAQVPDPPLIVSTVPRDGSLIVTWAPPNYDGGHSLSGYALDLTADGDTTTVATDADSATTTVTGLTNGEEYALSLTASNDVGPSAASDATASPSAAYVPSAPLDLTAQPDGSGDVLVSWQAPADDGGADVSGYVVTYQQVTQADDGTWSVADDSPVHTIPAAASATSVSASDFETDDAYYQFGITAENSVGTGAAATSSTPVTPAVDTQSTTVVLTTPTVDALDAVTASSLSWPLPAPAQAQEITVGDVIVSPAAGLLPQGTLRDVTSVTASGGQLILGTEQGQLSDAFENGSLSTTVNPETGTSSGGSGGATKFPNGTPADFAGTGTFHPDVAGVHLIPQDITGTATLSKSMTFGIDFHGQSGGGCDSAVGSCRSYSVSGSLNVTPSVSLGLTLNQGLVGVPDGVSVAASATVAATANISASVTASQTWQIGEIDGAPVDVQIGPVPVVIVPKVPVFLTVSGSAAVGVSASVTVGASVSWSSQNAGQLIPKNLSTPLKLSGGAIPGLSATGDVSVGLQVQPQLDIYDVAGPNVEADVDLDAALNFNPGPGDSFLVVSPSLELKAGLDLDLLGVHASLEVTVAVVDLPEFSIGSVPKAAYTVTTISPSVAVGKPTAFAAVRTDGVIAPLTWGLLGGAKGDTITSVGVLTAVNPPGRTVTITVRDASGVEGSTTVTIGTSFDAPTGITVSQDAPESFAVRVSWNPPDESGGSAVSQYRVSTVPSTGTHTSSSPTVLLSSLGAGYYTVSVMAINAKGIASPSATTIFELSSQGDLSAGDDVTSENGFPVPDDLGVPGSSLSEVACSGSAVCAAAGQYSQGGMLSVLADGSWTSVSSPSPAGYDGSGAPTWSVACDDSSHCFAAGSYTQDIDDSIIQRAVLATFDGSSWSAVPATELPGTDSGIVLNSIACAGDGYCIVTGSEGTHGILETLTDGVWVASDAASDLGFDPTTDRVAISGISCGAAGACAAFGSVTPSDAPERQFLATLSAGTWSNAAVPGPSDAEPGQILQLESLTCTGSSFCVIGGDYTDKHTYLDNMFIVERNGAWSAARAPVPANASGTPATPQGITSIACSNPTTCVAVGAYLDKSGERQGVNDVLNGGVWTASEAPLPSDAGAISDLDLLSVSCAPSGACAVVGNDSPASGGTFVYVETLQNGAWTTMSSANLALAGADDNGDQVASISCAAGGSCIAVGDRNVDLGDGYGSAIAMTIPLHD